MHRTTIKCKTTAPLFMAGPETRIPELRATGIKGNMRFIWRAIQCAGDISKLRELEGEIFGNAYGSNSTKASEMRLRVDSICLTTGQEVMTPHRNLRDEYNGTERDGRIKRAFPAPAIKTGNQFDVIITSSRSMDKHIDFIRLFSLTCLLYGFGRRSRKGFGTVVITDINGVGEDIDYTFDGAVENLKALSYFGAEYTLANNNTEIIVKSDNAADYPYIENIWIVGSKTYPDPSQIIKQIGMSVHCFAGEPFLGRPNPRFASSILLSTVPVDSDNDRYSCLVTQLHCAKNTANRQNFYQKLAGRL